VDSVGVMGAVVPTVTLAEIARGPYLTDWLSE
jgi:hypothetical protein